MAVSSPYAELAQPGRHGGIGAVDPTAGTPQGAVISPLLANLYLDPLTTDP